MARSQTEGAQFAPADANGPTGSSEPGGKSGKSVRNAPKSPAAGQDLKAELVGMVLLLTGALFALALCSYKPHDMDLIQTGRSATEGVHNWIGPVGARIADLLLQLFGVGSFLLAGLVLLLALRTLVGKLEAPRPRTAIGLFGMTLATLMLLHLGAQAAAWRPFGRDASGLLPGAVAVLCRSLLSTTGTVLLASWMLLSSAAALSGRSLMRVVLSWLSGRATPVVEQVASTGATAAMSGLQTVKSGLSSTLAWRPQRSQAVQAEVATAEAKLRDLDDGDFVTQPNAPQEIQFTVAELQAMWQSQVPAADRQARMDELEELPAFVSPAASANTTAVARLQVPQTLDVQASVADSPLSHASSVRVRLPLTPEAMQAVVHPEHHLEITPAVPPLTTTSRMSRAELGIALADLQGRSTSDLEQELMPLDQSHIAALVADVEDELPPPVPPETRQTDPGDRLRATMPAALVGPQIVMTEALRNPSLLAAEPRQSELRMDPKGWTLPPSSLLQEPPERVVECDAHVLRENASVLERKLAEFNIQGEVTEIRPGPVVTTYEYRPAPGTRTNKIVNLTNDLTMALSALRVRIVAPIPGRDVVGIEVPNQNRQMVYLREIVDSAMFRESPSPLPVILGKDIEGRPLVTDLAKAPHMLVAGATGTGKSVGVNSFIASILFRCTPDQVKLILVDPKILELSVYEGIPHLLLPVLDDPHKAELALKWACTEMDRRYKLLADAEVRNLAAYKAKLPELRNVAQRKKALAARLDIDGMPSDEEIATPEDPPFIVVVIDEFADLIMQSGKEVEIPVARLAQKARAAGIHVILATQRPSVDVITGMIKANFPTRVSFQVTSAMDSKVVLDGPGAETLLGRGDMLFKGGQDTYMRRCHGTWVTDEEVVALAKHWKDQGTPRYDMDILRDPEAEASGHEEDGEMDTLYDDAVRIAVEANQASVSFLQRKLGIGYGRSARIVDTMEKRGIVGPARGPNKPREILVHAL